MFHVTKTLSILFLLMAACLLAEPVEISISKNASELTVHFNLTEENAQITEDSIGVYADTQELACIKKTPPPTQDDTEAHYTGAFSRVYTFPASLASASIRVTCQVCLTTGICLMPTEVIFDAPTPDNTLKPASSPASTLDQQLAAWSTSGTLLGYHTKSDFLQWLQTSRLEDATLQPPQDDAVARSFSSSFWLGALLIILLGATLNLTPCILPVIPITLGVLGATPNATRRRRFALGLLYGLGITLAYGTIGIIAVITGGQFGAFNSSPWFNGIIGVIFLVLALSMFDIFSLDLSRLRGNSTAKIINRFRGSVFGAFLLGCISALLASACIAPVLISVLILAAKYHAEGHLAHAIGLPFLLGAGMALPWPLLAIGMGFLPKAGNWMAYTRKILAIIILGFACWYGIVAYKQYRSQSSLNHRTPLAKQLQQHANAPWVLLDFKTESCKNCTAMEAFILNDPDIQQALKEIPIITIWGDDNTQETQEALKFFDIKGFPTFILLKHQE